MNGNISQFIFNELTNIPTILATNSAKRADQTGVVQGGEDHKKPASSKPAAGKIVDFFAKGNEDMTSETVYQDQDDWNVRVFPNKYPLTESHEIIVHSPDPVRDIEDFPAEQTVKIIRAFLNRINYYTRQEMEVMIFNNRGGSAGASLTHPHSQLVALKGFPGVIELEKSSALRYYNEHHACYWCDAVQREKWYKDRIIYESDHHILICPHASRWSYEMKLIPKVHRPNFEYIEESEIQDLAKMLKAALFAYNELFDCPDRNFWVHTQRYDPYHWHMGFIPHIKVLGALELGAGIWVSDKATPEDAAKALRKPFMQSYEGEITSLL